MLFIVKNYAGDVMNFQMAAEMMQQPCATVLVNDDVAVERSTHGTGRRGVAGTLIVEKIVGAAAEAGASLDQCKALGDRVNSRTASMGVAFTSCTVPAAGRADLRHRRRRDGVRRRHPWRAGAAARPRCGRPRIWCDELMDAILGDLQAQAAARRCCCMSTASAARR